MVITSLWRHEFRSRDKEEKSGETTKESGFVLYKGTAVDFKLKVDFWLFLYPVFSNS